MNLPNLTPQQRAALAKNHRARLESCVPWNPAAKWEPELNFQGSTYDVMDIFPGIVASADPVDSLPADAHLDSPSGAFRYCVRLQKAGHPLLTWWQSQVGTVIFDTDVPIPALFERRVEGDPGTGVWRETPWMSLTPAEILSLRPGTRLGKGKVVIGGLGLGHQLIAVSKRLAVKRVVVVERSQELVDWLLPQIRPHVRKPLEVVVGDAYEVFPTLKADVALVDIFPGYGNNQAALDRMAASAPGIKKWWGWGAEEMSGRRLRER